MGLRIGIIGCGGIAGEHARGYLSCPGVEIVACADIAIERAQRFAAEYNVPRVYNDYRTMLAHEKLDAVSVCTPNYAHCEPTIAALEAGIHVLCEKPMAINVAEAERMVEAAQRTKKMLTIGHHFRFMPFIRFIKRRIDEGLLGDIYFGRSHALRRRGIPGWGEFHIRDKSGGGPLIDIGVHALDCILWLMGSPQPVTVSGKTYTMFGNRVTFFSAWGDYKRDEFDVEDFAAGFVRFSNGATLVLAASWAAHIEEQEDFSQLVLGDRGGVMLRPFGPSAGVRIQSSREEALLDVLPSGFPEKHPHQEEIRHWVACLRGEAEVLVKPEECLNVQRIIDGIYRSSELGREIRVEELAPPRKEEEHPHRPPRQKARSSRRRR
ncbi:MAG: Gfo/Idh/MocA family oxidoreductase [Candidatus Sumerlaeaceae bacterium]|nr:Gfo/Idh/MocA family oxidoreductase [Candidatus Sumerlaeaceae bacterium]